ncbi:MAG: hypothetical protein OEZ39_07360 [Gammaproteobacteria bacterium]|nr:hypothetical protein [Gammaproteobacteria bacterium]MDH5651676.1 hypothetical protein [Gammaproteobacteria bacterium]
MDFASTRHENDAKLLSRLDGIRSGRDLEVLEPFAKAYLGLYYDIDSRIPANERVGLLAGPDLSEAVHAGFVAALQCSDLPAGGEIAGQSHEHKSQPLAFVVLAGMDLLSHNSPAAVTDLPDNVLRAAICFHLTTNTFHTDVWYDALLKAKPQLAGDALLQLWQPMLQQDNVVLPGLHEIMQRHEYQPVLAHVLIPLLRLRPDCPARELAGMLERALLEIDPAELGRLIQTIIPVLETLPLRNRVYWLAAGFLLDPAQYTQTMILFMGQEKIKLLPLLDFSQAVLKAQGQRFRLSAMGYAALIRCLAPRFTPQEDQNGSLGEITVSVLWFFYQLACMHDATGQEALHWLQTVRVLKLYKEVFKQMATIQQSGTLPDFPDFVAQLREKGYLRMKKKWSDVR